MKGAEVPAKFAAGWLDRLDARLATVKDVRARFDALTDDLGGVDALSYQQRSLAERCVWLEHFLASQERALAEGKDFNVGTWVQASNSLQGLYKALGLSRAARKVETLAEYARRIAENSGGVSVP